MSNNGKGPVKKLHIPGLVDLLKGGLPGQLFGKTDNGTEWVDPPTSLPDGGTPGQFLGKTENGDEWVELGTAAHSDVNDFAPLTLTPKECVYTDLFGTERSNTFYIERGDFSEPVQSEVSSNVYLGYRALCILLSGITTTTINTINNYGKYIWYLFKAGYITAPLTAYGHYNKETYLACNDSGDRLYVCYSNKNVYYDLNYDMDTGELMLSMSSGSLVLKEHLNSEHPTQGYITQRKMNADPTDPMHIATKQFVEQKVGEVPEQVQVDFSQNDPDATDYIKNRTHWVEYGSIECGTIIGTPSNETTFTAYSGASDLYYCLYSHYSAGVREGILYINGVSYPITIGISEGSLKFTGDALSSGNLNPSRFYIKLTDGNVFPDGEVSLTISVPGGVYHSLDARYIPIGDSLEVVSGKVETKIGKPGTGVNAEMFNSATEASGSESHAEGGYTKATGQSSHAEGNYTEATGNYSHAEGSYTEASGSAAHAEGSNTTATGSSSHAEGSYTEASGHYSHAEGYYTLANGVYEGTHVQGAFNIDQGSSGTLIHIVGNGAPILGGSPARSNAHTLDHDGTAWYQGDVYVGSTSGTNKDEGSKKLATEEYVDDKLPVVTSSDAGKFIRVSSDGKLVAEIISNAEEVEF